MNKLVSLLIIWSFPVLTFAQGIVVCNPTLGADGKQINPCGFCDFGKQIKSISDWFVGISGIIVVLLIIGAGLRLVVVQDVDVKTTMRRLLTTALFGYMLILGAWVIVDTFIKFLIPGSEYGVNNPLIC